MEEKQTTKIALIRGNSLNEWEAKVWATLPASFEVTGICGRKNVYSTKNIPFSVKKLSCLADSRLRGLFGRYVFARNEKLIGLEKELTAYHIAHTAEISNFYTVQAVRAKKNNPRLKVVCTVWDNSIGRFETTWGRFAITPPNFWYRMMARYIREVILGVDLFLSVSDVTTAFLIERGVPKEKIQKILPAVTTACDNQGAQEFLLKHHLESGMFYIMVNRLVREKGVYDVLYAWKELITKENIQKKLVIIGSGPEQKHLINLAKVYGIDHRVVFVTSVPNTIVKGLYRHARALVLGSVPTPIWQEQFGYVLAESISAHTPVITTCSGAIPEVIGSAGIAVAPGSITELKNAFCSMEKDDVHGRLKEQCLKEYTRFSQERFVKDLCDAYSHL